MSELSLVVTELSAHALPSFTVQLTKRSDLHPLILLNALWERQTDMSSHALQINVVFAFMFLPSEHTGIIQDKSLRNVLIFPLILKNPSVRRGV